MTEPLPIAAALRGAIAQAVDCDPKDVSVTVDAPGLDGLRALVTIEIVGDADDAGSATGPEPEREPEALHVDAEVDAEAEEPKAPEPDEQLVDDNGDDEGGEQRAFVTPEDLDDEADAAADFLEGLLDALDLPGDLRIQVHADHAEIELVDIGTGALIGRRGQTLEAIQELVRCSLQREFQRRSRVMIDAEGYRARRLEKLLEKAEEAIDSVLDTGEAERLEPMDVFERKAVHRVVASVEGVSSRSQGREPARRIVIEPT